MTEGGKGAILGFLTCAFCALAGVEWAYSTLGEGLNGYLFCVGGTMIAAAFAILFVGALVLRDEP